MTEHAFCLAWEIVQTLSEQFEARAILPTVSGKSGVLKKRHMVRISPIVQTPSAQLQGELSDSPSMMAMMMQPISQTCLHDWPDTVWPIAKSRSPSKEGDSNA